MTAEVSSRSTLKVSIGAAAGESADPRCGDFTGELDAGQVHNPTIARQAEELEKVSGKRSFRTLFSTCWAETEEERQQEFEKVVSVWPSAKYVLYGPLETTEENKKNHCHCIVAFASSKQWKTIIKTLPPGKYSHQACRSFRDAREYCLKNDPSGGLEYGKPLQQGDRTDLKKLLTDGEYSPQRIREIDPVMYSRYRNGIRDVCADSQRNKEVLDWIGAEKTDDGYKRSEYAPAEVYWFHGATGTGKSRAVKDALYEDLAAGKLEEKNISLVHKIENGFAIGTIQEHTDVLVLDEFRGSSMKYSDLLALIDGCSINIKGSQAWVKAKKIYITSCFSPEECYPNLDARDSIQQLKRRITKVNYMGKSEETDRSRSVGPNFVLQASADLFD